MLDITPDEIALLNDVDLRELVGRLCEAELASRGLSPAAATWGGNQTAADGGLDVRVALPAGAAIESFIPRNTTGFQVKTPDMARAAILAEMRPAGAIRPSLQSLADESGSYVIISSHGSTADTALRNRRCALRDALADVANADHLHTDFYDRTRLATWVRQHPGLIAWVKEKVGRTLVGWRAYGAWSGPAEGVAAEYLLDDKLRLDLGKHRETPAQPIAETIDELRDELARVGKMVRLVGLSGVGKTRLVQALFDAHIGSRPLSPSLAIYANLSDNPDPQPTGLVSDLIASRKRAVLIVDNCPPDLHRRLSDLCSASGSTVSVLTVEYDVRDDQPEGTQVVTLNTSSSELIEKLVRRRYPHLSETDARTIADVSGGNARIAIALAGTVERSETVAGLSDEDLFQRLFRQRHDPDNALLLAAQACSLVYSFQGDALAGDEAELPRLAQLANQRSQELYRHVGELLRRDLVQQRSVWRAILPHAIANRLAARALEETPYELIDQQLVTGGTDRLARSFSRRLSFLHERPHAIAIVERWLAPGGLLGEVTAINQLGQAMFENVAPVSPEAALAAMERAASADTEAATIVWQRHRSLLRSLAYDPPLFERSALMLARAAVHSTSEREAKEAADTFVSLFTIYLSGTHATITQRLDVIERLLRSGEPRQRSLGLAALGKVLETSHFSSVYQFAFGARSRDYGFKPKSDQAVHEWYGAGLSLIERLAFNERGVKAELRELLARSFRGLWTFARMYDELEALSRRFAGDGFYREAWAACRRSLRYDTERLTPDGLVRLKALEAELRPSNLAERVRAVVLSNISGGLDLENVELQADTSGEFERLDALARALGAMVATDERAFTELLPDLLRGGNRAWQFGGGLCDASSDRRVTWTCLVDTLALVPPDERSAQVLGGFLAELWQQDRDLAHDLLDAALNQAALVVFLPTLHLAEQLDERGVKRLKAALHSGKVPISRFRGLSLGRTAGGATGSDLCDLLLQIADQPKGVDVALGILSMRLFSDRSEQRDHEREALVAGRKLIRRITFSRQGDHQQDYTIAVIAQACLTDAGGATVAAEIAGRLKCAVAAYETYSFDNDQLLKALLRVQPKPVLDVLLAGDSQAQAAVVAVFDHLGDHRSNPADEIPVEVLVEWCDECPETRYPLAASVITYAIRPDEKGPQIWSPYAKALLAHTGEPRAVLTAIIARFAPSSWSGSRAAIIETNASLLDHLPVDISADLAAAVTETKARLRQQIDRERKWETERDRERDERFE